MTEATWSNVMVDRIKKFPFAPRVWDGRRSVQPVAEADISLLKKRVARLAALLALITSMVELLPGSAQGQDFTYITNNGTITITGYIGAGGDVIIPSTITRLPV